MTTHPPPPDSTTPAGASNHHEWNPSWPPSQTTPLPPVTVVTAIRDEPDYMRLAFSAHQPHHGHITVHPTPLAGTGPSLAHDLIRALGKHLPLTDDRSLPVWATNADRSWRIATAWTLALTITDLTVCRAHRLSTGQWEQLLALSARTGIRLTLLCNGPIPPKTRTLLNTLEHQLLDTQKSAAAHWSPLARPRQPDRYPWWRHRAPFPPRQDELHFRTPPQPSNPKTSTPTPPLPPPPPGLTPPLPLPGPDQDYLHPHTIQIADRIHTRVAHPVHAACVAWTALTGHTSRQLTTTQTPASSALPPQPPWAAVLTDAARHLAALRGHPDAPNPLAVPHWEHHDIDQALHACRLLPTPPARRPRTPRTKTTHRPHSGPTP
ncbi:hypothetical protein [Streptomyces sp. RT42]|uniref:hypothetical protein n=1 Tax=Streptomyces sp. RT42 TaxID=2824898 RepID=UPI001B364829|nr:hypothetical protein [Streptomyces sp. RT42]MBQ0883194.1 hypothetical protein [Streptomyces sp. RT42]